MPISPSRFLFWLTSFTSIAILALAYGLFYLYLKSTAQEIIGNWVEAEAIAIQEGNYLAAMAKNQRVMSSSDFLRGVYLIDKDTSDLLAQYGENISQLDGILKSNKPGELIGSFTYLAVRDLGPQSQFRVGFIVGPRYGILVLFIFVSLLIGLTIFSQFVLRGHTDREARQREDLVRTAIHDLIAGQSPSRVLRDQVPALVHAWANMQEALETSTKKEIALAKDAALSQAALQIAHDIKSPLSALNMIASSAGIAKLDESEILRNVSRRISEIASTFLDQHHPRRPGKLTEINQLVRQIAAEKNHECSGRGIQVIVEESKTVAGVIDDIDFGRILSNLLNNAIEASVSSSPRVIVTLDQDPEWTYIRVTDFGHGFDPNIIGKVGLEPISSRRSGHGLGLHGAHQLLERWGGHLKIESSPGMGATVTVCLAVS